MLKKLFISEVRIKMLQLFLLEPKSEDGLHVREIARFVQTEINAVRRELDNLLSIGMLKRQDKGNKVFYTIIPEFPLIDELTSAFLKDRGLGKVILSNRDKLGKIKFAILSKEFVRGRIATSAQVDLLFVGDIKLDVLDTTMKSLQEEIGRDINFTVMSEDELAFRKSRKDNFLRDMLIQPYYMLIGDSIELAS